MANAFGPFGFRQFSGTGSVPTFEQVTLIGGIDYNTANIFQGDPVFRLSDGTIAGITTAPAPGTTGNAITQTGPIKGQSLYAGTVSGDINLTNAGNSVGAIAGFA